jgi:hypothetical protein
VALVMNTQIARNILNEAARLMELTATFQARYGKVCTMAQGTPQAAWQLADDILNAQTLIAGLLDVDALEDAHHPYGQWWQHTPVMEPIMARHIITEAAQLLSSAAYIEGQQADGKETSSHVLSRLQRAIAGMLHPNSYLMAQAKAS